MRRPNALDLLDVVVYAIVLALFVAVLPRVISESFPLTILTAVLLKGVLEIVLHLKKRIVGRIRGTTDIARRIGAAALLVLVMPGSKFLLIELTALLFGDAVQLGGFWSVTAVAVTLTLARLLVRTVAERLSAASTASR